MGDDDHKYLWDKRHDILVRTELSALYHQKRERFFDMCDRIAKAIAVVGGSAAIWKVSSKEFVEWAAIVITLTSTLSLVFGFSEKARRHSDLSRKYKALLSEIAVAGERDFTEENIKQWNQKIRLVEVEEPPTLTTLARMCQNELAIAAGHPEAVNPIPLYERLLMNFCDLPKPSR